MTVDINEILSSLSEEDMAQLKTAANALMGGMDKPKESKEKKKEENPLGNLFAPEVFRTLEKLSHAISDDDDRIALIKALKPLLSEPRQEKADSAIKMLKLIQLLPLLKDAGLLNGLL